MTSGLPAENAGFRAACDTPLPTEAKPWPSPRAAWYAVFVLVLSLFVNFLDRGILALLVPYIKADLRLSDTQISLVMGFAFVMFYMIAGLPIARHVDRGSRRAIMATGLFLWGGATALCGVARSFGSLFAFRMAVGVGEACTGPGCFSLIGDYFPPAKLARAIAVMNFGYIFGNGFAILIGGAIVGLLATSGSIALPLLGELRVWQAAFLLAGAPGLLVAGLMLTVKEPPRRVVGDVPSLRDVRSFVLARRTVYIPMIVGISLNTMVGVGMQSWGPAYFMRAHGWSVAQVGLVLGLLWITIMPVGALLGGWLAEELARRGRRDANMRITIYSSAANLPFLVAMPFMPNGALAAISLGVAMFCTSLHLGPQNAAMQMVTPNRMRGQITAVILFGFNIVGYGFGPTITALFTDYLFQDEAQVGFALAACAATLAPISIFVMALGLRPYVRAVADLDARGEVSISPRNLH